MADLLLHNATFFLAPGQHAARLYLRNGLVHAIDPNDTDLPPHLPRLDLAGHFITPGLHDAHLHLYWRGEQLYRYADLRSCVSPDDLADRLRSHALRLPDGWVLGRGFDQELLPERAMPTRALLDRALPARPTLITRVCGHVGVLSSQAIAQLPPEVALRGDTESGLFVEDALWEALGYVPAMSDDELDLAALLALREAHERGFTAVTTMLEEARQLASLERLAARGQLPVRVVANVPGSAVNLLSAHGRITGWHTPDHQLTVGAAKFFSDGTFGARTAFLRHPYTDAPTQRGRRLLSADEMTRKFTAAAEMGYRIAVHAIGDAALDECLTALEAVSAALGPRHDRIEHVALADNAQLDRLARISAFAVVQPQFATSDTWLDQRLGPQRVQLSYRFRAMLDRGIPVALSSDCPVETLDPDACLHAALAGCPWNGQRLTQDQALHAYTATSAAAGGIEHLYGRLLPGLPADLTRFTHPPAQNGRVHSPWIATHHPHPPHPPPRAP